jgi:hypothetical protein
MKTITKILNPRKNTWQQCECGKRCKVGWTGIQVCLGMDEVLMGAHGPWGHGIET